jgi:release factor glutamine methyltransferase
VSTPNVAQLLREAATRLPGEEARHEAELLLLHALGVDRAWLFSHADDAVDEQARQRFELLVTRRAEGHPLAYLTGRRGFWTLDLQVNTATLIPRPETELLVEQALARLPADDMVRVADMGTGSGAIALSIASERPLATVMATDVLGPTLAVAVKNAQAHGLENVWFRRGHWYTALGADRFDMIVSNPPYIAAGDPHLQQGDLRFEPPPALASGADGLDAIREIIGGAHEHLVPGGWLLMEHGWDQGPAIRALLEQAGFIEAQTVQDLEQRDRVTLGRLPG